jgi:hypothetical protein
VPRHDAENACRARENTSLLDEISTAQTLGHDWTSSADGHYQSIGIAVAAPESRDYHTPSGPDF